MPKDTLGYQKTRKLLCLSRIPRNVHELHRNVAEYLTYSEMCFNNWKSKNHPSAWNPKMPLKNWDTQNTPEFPEYLKTHWAFEIYKNTHKNRNIQNFLECLKCPWISSSTRSIQKLGTEYPKKCPLMLKIFKKMLASMRILKKASDHLKYPEILRIIQKYLLTPSDSQII